MTHTNLTRLYSVLGFHAQAATAITAAKFAARWGDDAAVKFAVKRGCPMRLVKIALCLERDVHHELY